MLGRQVRLKYLPELEFLLDPAIEQGQRVEAILRSINEERAGDPSTPADPSTPEASTDGDA